MVVEATNLVIVLIVESDGNVHRPVGILTWDKACDCTIAKVLSGHNLLAEPAMVAVVVSCGTVKGYFDDAPSGGQAPSWM